MVRAEISQFMECILTGELGRVREFSVRIINTERILLLEEILKGLT